MGRSGNPVLSEEQKKKLAMRNAGPPKRGGGGRGGGGGMGGPPGRGRGGPGGPPGRGGGGPPPGRGGFGAPPPPGFAQARYGFFTNDMPSGPIGHVNKQFVDSRPPVMTPSASSVGGGDRPIRPPNGGLIFPPGHRAGGGPGGEEGANWVPVGPPRSLMDPMGGGRDGPPGMYGAGRGGGGAMPPSGNGAAAARAAGGIHELFGKMVWKKMEVLEDSNEVDSLQNEIMDLISKAVKRQQERKTKEEEERPRNGGDGNSEAIPYGRPHAANNGEPPAYGSVPEFGGYQPYQGPGFF